MGQLPELMTVAEVAERLRLSDETVHRWARDGRIEYVNVLGVKRFRRAYIEALVAATATTATAVATTTSPESTL